MPGLAICIQLLELMARVGLGSSREQEGGGLPERESEGSLRPPSRMAEGASPLRLGTARWESCQGPPSSDFESGRTDRGQGSWSERLLLGPGQSSWFWEH